MIGPRRMGSNIVVCSALATLALAGCGSGSQEPAKPVARGVFTSASDCAEAGTLTLEQCSNAIAQAVANHEKTAATYTTLKKCEATEGTERCERTAEKVFRPRLLAFAVTPGKPPSASPLYASGNGQPGFKMSDKKVLQADDESLTFSRAAMGVAELHAGKSGGGASPYKF